MLVRERTEIRVPLLQRLPKLRLISQRSACPGGNPLRIPQGERYVE